MLGFILSKMQMLLFAVGIALVAMLFYNFVSQIGLSEEANNLITTDAKLVSDQLNIEGFSSFDTVSIPDRLSAGLAGESFFYDLDFSKTVFGSGENTQNLLLLRVLAHNSNKNAKPSDRAVIASKSVATDAAIVLIDPGFIPENTGLETHYDVPYMTLYPRAAGTSEQIASAPNGFAVVKEIKNGAKFLYIIPCASAKEPNNCLRNIIRVGCYKLKMQLSDTGNVTDSTLVDSAFNVTTQAENSSGGGGSGGYISTKSTNYKWGDCKCLFPEITGQAGTNC